MDQLNYGSFATNFEIEGEIAFIAMHPEMFPAKQGISPSGRYFIYCIHPERGSCTCILQQDEDGTWFSEHLAPFIDDN